MKFCPVVPVICRGQVHGPQERKEKEKKENNNNNNKKRSKNNKSPNFGNQTLFGRLNNASRSNHFLLTC